MPRTASTAARPIARSDDLGSGTRAPRYKAIYEELARGIRTGQYPVMTLLPTEHELCERYDASRHTVREAIRLLTEAGMVSRRPGVGTRVETARATTRYTQRISAMSDLFQYIKNANLRVLDSQLLEADDSVAGVLGCQPGQVWLRVRAIKSLGAQNEPVAYVHGYVHPDYAAIQPDIGRVKVPLSRLIEERYSQRIHEVSQEFSATPIEGEMADYLKVAPQTAGLVIARRYYGEHGTLMLATVTTFPHTKMKYSMSLKLDWHE
ncbi:GntR family transcriptional regulator [Bordetella genomosp. 1]|uniref:GntR family transcriptional regulator n=1 Tax=Bordetella genomosp. 1 TaxID=1395607 RepID=A0ABX4F3U2_9BORD|nr:GntR family transcriptional regulator [Bordetella genomosp. 1]OZI68428.1 GntR family transcriptional regulator [Bordetella genomosp. 1]